MDKCLCGVPSIPHCGSDRADEEHAAVSQGVPEASVVRCYHRLPRPFYAISSRKQLYRELPLHLSWSLQSRALCAVAPSRVLESPSRLRYASTPYPRCSENGQRPRDDFCGDAGIPRAVQHEAVLRSCVHPSTSRSGGAQAHLGYAAVVDTDTQSVPHIPAGMGCAGPGR